MNPRVLPSLIGLISLAGTAQAAEQHIETTIVTASRTEQTLTEALAPVTVFERADIERVAPQDLQELLSRAVGVSFVRNGGRGASASLFLRGNQSNHTLVLIDGVRIGSATLGSASITNLPPELIERVEIVRGPRSTLYGSDAIGGVINIITRKFHDTNGVKPYLRLGAGTQGSFKGVAAISGGNAQTQFNLTALAEDTDGIDNTASKTPPNGDDDAFEQQAFNLSASHRISRTAELFAFIQQSHSESDYDTNCYGTGFAKFDCAPYTDSQVTVANLRGEFQLAAFWTLTATAGRSTDESETKYSYLDPAATGVTGDVFETTRDIVGLQNDFKINEHHLLTLGAEQLRDQVDSSLSYGEDERDNDGVYLQWQGDMGPVNAALGWRNDNNEQFGSTDTRNASAGVELAEGLRVVASYGEGFNAPTFNDLYYPGYGNPDLAPESSKNRELSLKGDTGWGRWSLNYFRNDVDNLIQYNPATGGPDQIESAQINGYELVISTELAGWNIDTNASYMEPTDGRSGLDLRRRARRQFNIDVDRQWQRWGVNLGLRAVGSRFENASNTDRLAGYALLDFGVSYQLSESLKLQLAVKNALDKDYVSARSSSFGDYQSLGREAMFTITYAPQ